jgi:hypothetical protein
VLKKAYLVIVGYWEWYWRHLTTRKDLAMSDQMNMDAERAEDLAAFKKWKGYELPALNNHGQFHQEWLHREFVAFCAGRRRTAPSAPMGEELPAPDVYYDGLPYYTKATVERIVAPYAERIRQLERELAERKTASIGDDPEFHGRLDRWHFLVSRPAKQKALASLIAYIDGRTAGAAPAGWKLVPIEPTDEMREACKVLNYCDDIDAEWARLLASAPTPMNSGKEEGK